MGSWWRADESNLEGMMMRSLIQTGDSHEKNWQHFAAVASFLIPSSWHCQWTTTPCSLQQNNVFSFEWKFLQNT
jgi:hypothetical protein